MPSTIDPRRTVAELNELRRLTGDEHGAQRVAFTPVWQRTRQWLEEKLAELPVETHRDAAGNLWSTLPGDRPDALVIGGHMDSVPNGGWLDGCLNVLAGLEILRRIAAEYSGKPPITVRLVDWADEEGARFGKSLFGSSACSGNLDIAEAARLKDKDGMTLPDALRAVGIDFARVLDAAQERAHAKAYLELHIEQGPVLLDLDLPLGTVLGTFGVERHAIIFRGQAAHSGSTPMNRRKDALLPAGRMAPEIYRIAARHGGVCTIGSVTTKPGIVTSVVEECRLTLDQRHLGRDGLAAMLADARAASEAFAAEAGVSVTWERIWQIDPVLFHPQLLEFSDEAIAEVGAKPMRLPSGPLHDAAEMGRAGIPTIMMFVQSLHGISHNKIEDTKVEHLELAVRAFDRLARKTLQWLCLALMMLSVMAAGGSTRASAAGDEAIRGLPFTRFYAYDEIGDVSRGARLGFDLFGRLAVVHRGAFVVLNDADWIDRMERITPETGILDLLNVAPGSDGRLYYTASYGWGVLEPGPTGRLRPHSLVPEHSAKWATSTSLTQMVPTPGGMYLGGSDGVVYINLQTGEQTLIGVPSLARLIQVGSQVFASVHGKGIESLDLPAAVLRPLPGMRMGGVAVDQSTMLDDRHALISTVDGRMFRFDGRSYQPWSVDLGSGPDNRVSAMCKLADQGVAIAVNGRGLFLVSPSGKVTFAVNTTDFLRITELAARDPGVLWVATESGIVKVLYRTAVTTFGQGLGLPVSWPQVVRWDGHIVVASSGRMYTAIPGSSGAPAHFEPMKGQPAQAVWAVAAKGTHLLAGNGDGLYAAEAGQPLHPVSTLDAERLILVGPDLCFVVGEQIAALRWTGTEWRECAPRIPGVGYPSVAHAAANSGWVELGPNRAARVWLEKGQLHARVFENFPWRESAWINVSVLGDRVVMSGPFGRRIYFDESKAELTSSPEWDRILDAAPFPVTRLQRDGRGRLWATHDRGVFTIDGAGGQVRFDTATFDAIDDRSLQVQPLGGGDVWISSGQSLYHVDADYATAAAAAPAALQPVLVSIINGPNHIIPLSASVGEPALLRFPYHRSDVSLRFFAGQYGYRWAPRYEFRLGDSAGDWTPIGTGSQLNFPELREGDYALAVRLATSHGLKGPPLSLHLQVLPPWYRTWLADAGYVLAVILVIAGWVRWLLQRTRARNVELEQLVEARTNELSIAMQKLNEETRNAATLAERHRLAGEIHDSLQQGLSGLILQIDATLKMKGLTDAIRSRLEVARRMVSFTRQEVQHAVWDMESPLLEHSQLDEALRKVASMVTAGTARIAVEVGGTPRPLPAATQHHLLRMAQEAMSNAVRHASPGAVDVRLDFEPRRITLTVTDDGCGFDPAAPITGPGHFGLRGLQDRARKIGADLRIDSASGRGTRVSVIVPGKAEALVPERAALAGSAR